jgi:hypothetical protein
VYHGAPDPVRKARQVLDTLVYDFLGGDVEAAFVESLEGLIVLGLIGFVLAPVLPVLGAFRRRRVSRWLDGLVLAELAGPPRTREYAENETLEEGLDDVHHIRAEVPDHIELVQHGQWTPVVDTGREANVGPLFPGMVGGGVGLLALRACLAVCPRCRRSLRPETAPQGIIRAQPSERECIVLCTILGYC